MNAGDHIGPYQILSLLGEGGMGVVYRAKDTRLGREVALKFLPPDLAQVPAALERFKREATVISSLNHPHICTLYDIGAHEGRHYLVLELLEGQSLRQLVSGEPLPEDRITAIALQIADALDAAHAKGIVHRDIKPGNILITTRGDAKLLDFGVAKPDAFADAADVASDPTREPLTARGAWIGTPEYMSPEQVRGETADARTDLFALGAVMFEMATGRAAFASSSIGASVDAVLNRKPPRPIALNPRMSTELERITLKALEKEAALRYQSAKELMADLRRLRRDTPAAASAPAPALAAARPNYWPPILAGVAIVVASVAGAGWWLTHDRAATPTEMRTAHSPTEPARLVILPFENLTRQQDDDWLSAALADSIGAGLQNLETLILVPRERVVELYAAESRSQSDALSSVLARQLSQRLRVRYYVHGSYQKVGDQLRVVARLVDLDGDAIKAQETLTTPFAQVLQLQDQLASRFAVQLGPSGALAARADASTDLEAYRLVTEARTLYALGRFAEAKPLLQRAIERDPKYALAWATLSKSDSRLVSPAMATGRPSEESLKAALDAATRAVELAPSSAESQIALALAHRGLLNRGPMTEAAQRAVALDPRNGEPRIILGGALSIAPGFGCPTTTARPEESIVALREGLRDDPLHASGYLNLTTHLWWMDRPVEALAVVDEGLAATPGNLLLTTSRPFNLVFANRVDEAEAILNQRASSATANTPNDVLTRVFIALRRRQYADAEKLMKGDVAQRAMGVLAWTMIAATAHFQAGRSSEGAALLERGIRAEPSCAQWATIVPALQPFRTSPEFQAALQSR